MTEQSETPKGNMTIVMVYIFLCIANIFIFTPIIPVHLTGATLIPLVLFFAWCLRFRKSHDTLIYNHMIYISRTIWMWSFILTITASIAGYLVYQGADNSIIQDALNSMTNGNAYTHAELFDILMNYIRANMGLMLSATLLCVLPPTGYIVYRLTRGIMRALKGYRLANPHAWF